MQTLFEQYGGFPKVSRIVSTFYERVTESPKLADYFADTDMRQLIDHQTKFIASVMGGPASFTDQHLARVHAHLGITSAAFDEAVLILRESLEDHGMEESDIGTVVSSVRARKPYIVFE